MAGMMGGGSAGNQLFNQLLVADGLLAVLSDPVASAARLKDLRDAMAEHDRKAREAHQAIADLHAAREEIARRETDVAAREREAEGFAALRGEALTEQRRLAEARTAFERMQAESLAAATAEIDGHRAAALAQIDTAKAAAAADIEAREQALGAATRDAGKDRRRAEAALAQREAAVAAAEADLARRTEALGAKESAAEQDHAAAASLREAYEAKLSDLRKILG